MKTVNLQINKKLFDEVDALLINNMAGNDTFYYQFDGSSRQNIITMLWLANDRISGLGRLRNAGSKADSSGRGVSPFFFCSEPRVVDRNARFLRLRYPYKLFVIKRVLFVNP